MKFVSRFRFVSLLRFSCIALASLVLSGQASHSTPERFDFPYKNFSDLRGILNVFSAFRRACLDQPVTRDLPARLVPEDYLIVTPEFHWWGKDNSPPSHATILSKTGREEEDFVGGHPIVEFRMPNVKKPNGHCSVIWKRKWDYPDNQVPNVMLGTAVRLDSQVSFRLEATLVSVPHDGFRLSDKYFFHSEWRAPCWRENTCKFTLTGSLHTEKGIDMTLTRNEVLRDETKKQE